ncbi:MAG TPA: phasin family protein [Pseudolabrys sp.]|nr:phasin family protein [Pseudolabrys sp.]
MEGQENFDVAAGMRDFAEKSIEQTRTVFGSLVNAAQQAATAVQNQTLVAQSGAREVHGLATRMADDNISAAFDFIERLTRAKDAKEATALHADFVTTRFAALADQARELSRQTVKLSGATIEN